MVKNGETREFYSSAAVLKVFLFTILSHRVGGIEDRGCNQLKWRRVYEEESINTGAINGVKVNNIIN